MTAELVGYDPQQTAGMFTFGGTGTRSGPRGRDWSGAQCYEEGLSGAGRILAVVPEAAFW